MLAISGGIAGGVIGLVLLIVVIIIIYRKSRKYNATHLQHTSKIYLRTVNNESVAKANT